jgi:spermidine/putrescine transport system permease protein
MTERSLFRRLAIGATVLWLGVFVLVPNLMVVVASLLARDEFALFAPRLSLRSYRDLLDPVFFTIFSDSLLYALTATALCLAAGYPFAYLLARRPPRWRRLLLVLVIVPFWTSSLIRTYALIILLKANGLLNALLMAAGAVDAPLEILYTDAAVLIGQVYTLLPFMILPLYGSIEKLDPRLVEAAYDLGASRRQVFGRVILPLTMPGIIAGCILVFLPALGLFYIPDLLGGARSMLIGNFIKNQFLTARDWPFGAAASVVLVLIMSVLLLAYFRSLKRFNASVME